MLLIDEDENSRLLTSTSLRDAGYRVLVATEPGEGLALLDAYLDLDLIILDLKLATKGGPLLIEFLTCNRPTLPIFLYTAATLCERVLDQARALGVSKCLRKGAASDLIEAARQALEAQPVRIVGSNNPTILDHDVLPAIQQCGRDPGPSS